MNATVALQHQQTLAEALREQILVAVSGSGGVCLWCGSREITWSSCDEWPPSGVVRCAECDSELHVERPLAPRVARA
jgi:hypothetical protein